MLRYGECHFAVCIYVHCQYANCHYAECHHTECRGATKTNWSISNLTFQFRQGWVHTIKLITAVIKKLECF
jgi:hypothetical protein